MMAFPMVITSRAIVFAAFCLFFWAEQEVRADESGPVQSWKFAADKVVDDVIQPVVGELRGEILGAFEMGDDEGLPFLRLRPSPEGKREAGAGGIILSRDPVEAKVVAGAMTAEAWVKLDSTLEWGGIIGAVRDTGAEEDGWILGYRNDRFYFGLAAENPGKITYLNASSPFVLGAWYHVVATYDGKELQKIYVDGRLAGHSRTQRGPVPRPDPFFYMLGSYRDDDNDFPMSGCLAEVSVWHRELSAEEIARRLIAGRKSFRG